MKDEEGIHSSRQPDSEVVQWMEAYCGTAGYNDWVTNLTSSKMYIISCLK